MAVTNGFVANIKVNKDFNFAFFWIEEESTGTPELFILWDPPAAPYDYFYHNKWLLMLQDAIVHNLPVQIGHDEDSSIVLELLIARSSP